MLEYSMHHLKYFTGGSLREYLVLSGKLPWLQAAIFLKQMTDAVCFLQEKRIVYLNWQSKLQKTEILYVTEFYEV